MLLAVLNELKTRGGEARLRELLPDVAKKLKLTEYELGTYEKSGYIRWISVIHFFSIDCVKAGYLTKSGGRWRLTAAGEKAIEKVEPKAFFDDIRAKYRLWKEAQEESAEEVPEKSPTAVRRQVAYSQALEQAQEEIEDWVSKLGPYDFQQLVAELLKAMGYFIGHIAPPGADGGIDIIAYKDPLGAAPPWMKIQVKHRESKATPKELRELIGLLKREGDVGLFVSSGGFTPEAEKEARAATKHVEIMDLDRMVQLWEQHYDKVSQQGRELLPLVRLSFLAPPTEEN
jgi:restriction system protein